MWRVFCICATHLQEQRRQQANRFWRLTQENSGPIIPMNSDDAQFASEQDRVSAPIQHHIRVLSLRRSLQRQRPLVAPSVVSDDGEILDAREEDGDGVGGSNVDRDIDQHIDQLESFYTIDQGDSLRDENELLV
jgi:hypothetical protein